MPLGLTSSIALGGHRGEALLCVTLHMDMTSRILTFGKVLNLYKSEKWSYGQQPPWNPRYRFTKKITGSSLTVVCLFAHVMRKPSSRTMTRNLEYNLT